MASLSVKYRPTSFNDGFVGQNITAEILRRTIENKKFKNIMLFAGSSGCGKTTSARIVARLINNGIGDPIEVDAASNNGVDQVRAIVDSANQRSLVGEYKIFIIDECHMITTQGWNAFLKCIEECPKYTIFIFCTTDPQKIPQTVLNRMQRFNFSPVPANDIKNRLMHICSNEGFTNYESACDFISRTCKGCMREAITNLERCADFSTDLSIENVKQVLSGLSFENMFKLTWALQDSKESDVFSVIDYLYNSGQDLKNFIDIYLEFILDLAKYSIFKSIDLTNIPEYLATNDNPVVQFTTNKDNSLNYFNSLATNLLELKALIKYDTEYKSTIEAFLINFIRKNGGV